MVTRLRYLGTYLNTNCRYNNKDVIFRIKKAGNAFGVLRKCLFSNPNISVDAKRAVYEGPILPTLLYGALFSIMRVFYHRRVRSMCRISIYQYQNFRTK